jgi:hypothetical protein
LNYLFIINKKMFEELIKGKLEAGDVMNSYSITADYGWGDAVMEARERGVPIASFGDTSDKRVFHAGHLGYYKFDYYWGRGSWGSDYCWENATKEEDLIKGVNADLLEMAKKFKEYGHKVKICFPSGNGKGYLSTIIIDYPITESEKDQFEWGQKQIYDMVLFVYNIDETKMRHYLTLKDNEESTIADEVVLKWW